MKPLHLLNYPDENSLSGIPGITHNGQRVLLYPYLIDYLQTYDHCKHVFQNLERLTEYR